MLPICVPTDEQLERCHRLIDQTTGEPFYRVASQSVAATTYTVRAVKKHHRYYVTCTCPAGLEGRRCWHKLAASVHAVLYHALWGEHEERAA